MLNLIGIYGPPASGKETIARAFAEANDYYLLTNHKTLDFVGSIIPQRTPAFFKLIDDLRIGLICELLNQGRNVVFTFSHCGNAGDDFFIRRLSEQANASRASMFHILLHTSRRVLLKRIVSPSRTGGKLRNIEDLNIALYTHTYKPRLPSSHSLLIDSGELDVGAAIDRIVTLVDRHYGL